MAKTSMANRLPATALSRISQLLDVPDVLSFAHTCSSLYSVVTHDGPLWKKHCSCDFVCNALPAGGARTWFEQWLYLCREFGRYRACYAQVKSAWNQIEAVLRQRCPQALSQLMASGAASETDLNELEGKLGMKLPDDYRCSLRIHGKLSVPLGCVSYPVKTYYPSEEIQINHQTFSFLGVEETRVVTIRPGWSELCVGYVAVAENVSSVPRKSSFGMYSKSAARQFRFMVSSDMGAVCADCPIGHVFTAFSSPIEYGHGRPGGCCVDMNRLFEWFRIPESATFADWLSAEADRMKYYYVTSQKRQLTRFILKPECVAVTKCITVRVATAVLSKQSADGWFRSEQGYVALLLIVELCSDAPAEDSCQLVQECLLVDGKQLGHRDCSFVQIPPQITLHPGDVAEYLSKPLLTKMNAVLGGYIVMRTVPGSREVRVNLPKVTLEPVLVKHFSKVQ